MRVLLVEPGKAPRTVEIGDTLEAMQAVVGGPIQAVYPFREPVALVCHSEGKLLGLPVNRALTDPQGMPYDIVCGTFFLVGVGEEHFTSLTGEQLKRYQDKYSREMVFTVTDRSSREKTKKKERYSHER